MKDTKHDDTAEIYSIQGDGSEEFDATFHDLQASIETFGEQWKVAQHIRPNPEPSDKTIFDNIWTDAQTLLDDEFLKYRRDILGRWTEFTNRGSAPDTDIIQKHTYGTRKRDNGNGVKVLEGIDMLVFDFTKEHSKKKSIYRTIISTSVEYPEVRHGTFSISLKNGNPYLTAEYSYNDCRRLFTYWTNNNIQAVLNIHAGRLAGNQQLMYDNGNSMVAADYGADGMLHGIYAEHEIDGTLRTVKNYYNGREMSPEEKDRFLNFSGPRKR
ncbi:MAG: hypothetical protein V1729_03015 [Candidatus Woesearchaeota archaeon]